MSRVLIIGAGTTALDIKKFLCEDVPSTVIIDEDVPPDEAKSMLNQVNEAFVAQCSLGIRRSAFVELDDVTCWIDPNKKSKGDKKRAARDRRRYGVY